MASLWSYFNITLTSRFCHSGSVVPAPENTLALLTGELPQSIPLVLAIVLRLITSRYHHPLIFPCFFLAIPLVFYAIALPLGYSLTELREGGWIFDVNGNDTKWYTYWTLFGK